MTLRNEVRQFIKEAQKRMRLEHWTLNLKIEAEDDKETLMTVGADGEYLQAIITVYEKTAQQEIKRFGIESIRQSVYHELSHILTNELKELAFKRFTNQDEINSAWERLAEHISRIVLDSPKILEEK